MTDIERAARVMADEQRIAEIRELATEIHDMFIHWQPETDGNKAFRKAGEGLEFLLTSLDAANERNAGLEAKQRKMAALVTEYTLQYKKLETERDQLRATLGELIIRADLMYDRIANPPKGGWCPSGIMDGHLDAINNAKKLNDD